MTSPQPANLLPSSGPPTGANALFLFTNRPRFQLSRHGRNYRARMPELSQYEGRMRIYVSDKAAAELSRKAEALNATGGVLGRAVIENIINEGILDKMIAGIDVKQVVDRPKRHRGGYLFQGERLSLPAISDITGVPAYLIRRRLEYRWPLEKAATTPPGESRFKRRRHD